MTEPENRRTGKPIHNQTPRFSAPFHSTTSSKHDKAPEHIGENEVPTKFARLSSQIFPMLGLALGPTPLNSINWLPKRRGLYHTELATNAAIAAASKGEYFILTTTPPL
jgi:hypothetical protein